MPAVDVAFKITGGTIPVDHGYLLFSAIANVIPRFHAASVVERPVSAPDAWAEIGVHPVCGRLVGGRRLELGARSHLVIRAPTDLIGELLPLAGISLAVGNDRIHVGLPTLWPLRPAARLRSRLVLIKGHETPDAFLSAVHRQLADLGVVGEPALLVRRHQSSLEGRAGLAPCQDQFVRRTMRIKDVEVPGYAVEVSGLDADSSIRLQERGIGGRRHFGAGVFVPARG